MTSDTENIFSRFYERVEDYKIKGLDADIVDEMLNGYLKAVISQPYIRRLFQNIKFDEDVGEVNYTMRTSWDNDADLDFVEEMFALGMVCQWLSPRYHSTLNTNQVYSNKELSFYSQANHMAELHNMYQKAQIDLRKYIRDRGFSLGYINTL